MRKALIVGINYYQNISKLYGCANDANKVRSILERNSDNSKNFDINIKTSDEHNSLITRKELKNLIEKLFEADSDIALLYFSGHGYIEKTGGYLITSECSYGDDGLSMNELMILANDSPADNKLIILDCCHSGILGNMTPNINNAVIGEGVTILTASSAEQYAIEQNGSGIFTSLLVDALNGSASNLLGEITLGSVYAHIDQSLGSWQQRPIFKTNVSNFVTLRTITPPITLHELRKIIDLFPEREMEFSLDPSFEPESANPDKGNTKKFALLQKYNRVNLLMPLNAPHMFHAAMNSKSCKLTELGKHYWHLVNNNLI